MLNQAIDTQIQQLLGQKNTLIGQRNQLISNLESAKYILENSKGTILELFPYEERESFISFLFDTINNGLGLIGQIREAVNEDSLSESFEFATSHINSIQRQLDELTRQEQLDVVALFDLVFAYISVYQELEDAIWSLEVSIIQGEGRKTERNLFLEEYRLNLLSFRCEIESEYARFGNGINIFRVNLEKLSISFQELRELPSIIREVLAEGQEELNSILNQYQDPLNQFIDILNTWENEGYPDSREVGDLLDSVNQWFSDFISSYESFSANFHDEHYQIAFYFLDRYLQEFNCFRVQFENINFDRSFELSVQTFQLKDAEVNLPVFESQIQQMDAQIHQLEIDLEAYPQYMVSTFQDSVPVLLMPVRIEAKFIHKRRDELPLKEDTTVKEETEPHNALWVRILPDDIAISSHEKKLTAQEFQAGQEYWNSAKDNLSTSGQSSEGASFDLGAWRVLSNRYGIYRAAWIVKETKPRNFSSIISFYEDQFKSGSNGDPIALPAYDFPTLSLKDLSWSEPAQSHVLPDRFVLTLYTNYPSQTPRVIIGEKLPESLQVGFNLFNDESEIDDIVDLLRNDANLKWLVDFEEAIKVGMAFKVDLGDISLQDYKLDRLVVLGIKSTVNNERSSELLQELLESHHYTSGFKFPSLGTPTNNSTEPDSTGYSRTEDQNAENGYWIELGSALFEETSNHSEKADGQRLAEALGIRSEIFHHVLNSQKQDVSEAIAMNTSLWRGTLGYYLEQMLQPAVSRDDIAKTREFFVKYVQARGPLPSISVGKQPYGILPVSRLTAWVPLPDAHPFESGLNKILQIFDQEWDKLVPFVSFYGVNPANLLAQGKGDVPVNNNHLLLQILGLEASSSEFYQRFGFGQGLVSYLNLAAPSNDVYNPIYQYFNELGIDLSRDSIISKILNVVFQTGTRKLIHTFRDNPNASFPAGKLIDSKPFSEIRKIEPFYALSDNYIHWLMFSNFDELRKEDFSRLIQNGISYNNHNPNAPQIPNLSGTPQAPRSLLYLMLRHALMLEYWNAAMQVKESIGQAVAEDRIEKELFNILDASGGSSVGTTPAREDIAPWEHLYSASPFEQDKTIWESLTVDSIRANEPTLHDLSENFLELGKLADMPTARLERAFAEHLDLCSYRLDAWQTGQINQRMHAFREGQSSGIYLGAFGFLEDLKPNVTGRNANHPGLYEFTINDSENMGYIHAPSNKQAVAAAVLRQGHMSHKKSGSGDQMAVNLSSERVRKALDILAGVREGQRLEALLGYELERGMHERYSLPAGVELDQYIAILRDKFPLVSKQILPSDANEDSKPTETLEARNVVDGLALLEAAKVSPYPYGISTGLPDNSVNASSLDKAKAKAIIDEVSRIANMLDAVNDLLLSESVYQTTQGNYDRANATLDSVAKGQFPPIPEVIQTPRSGYSLTNRVVLNFESLTSPVINSGWGSYTATPFALAEPSLNAWLSRFLGDPAQIKVKVNIAFSNGQAGGAITNVEVSIADLKLQPLDLIYLSEKDLEEQGGEFQKRVENYVLNNNIVTDTVEEVSISPSLQLATTAIHLWKLMPLIERLREVVGSSKALTANDLLLPEQITGDSEQILGTGMLNNLLIRVTSIVDGLDNLSDTLDSQLSTLNYAGLTATLNDISFYGFPEAIPTLSVTGIDNQSVLVSTAQSVRDSVVKRLSQATDLVASGTYESLLDAVKVIFSKGFKILPHFTLPTQSSNTITGNKFSLQTAVNNSGQVVYNPENTPFIMDEWLQGVAKVKEKMEVFEKAAVYNELLNGESTNYFPLSLNPVQLPARYNSSGTYEDRWLGTYFGDDFEPDGDKLSLIMHLPNNFSASGTQVGLLLDEWVEVIPGRTETTEVAFHYDKPNSEPAQTLLLAITPEVTGNWNWNNLFETVNETLDRAKKRAVDPDLIATTPIAHILPAIVAPVDSLGATIGLDFGRTAGNPLFEPAEPLQPSS